MRINGFLKMLTLSLLLVAGSMLALAQSKNSNTPPNIVVILADDLGYSDIGCYGSEIATPTLDRLAAQGTRLTRFYNAARCCPTRASLLTGLYPHQAGVGDMVDNLGTPAYQGYLNSNCVTIAEALKPAGYATLMSGKWHVGAAKGRQPLDRGFDRYFGLLDGAANYFEPTRPYRPQQQRSPLRVLLDSADYAIGKDFYMTDAISAYADTFIRQVPQAQPLFLYLAYTAPHWPLHAREADIAKYRGRYKAGWQAIRNARYAKQQRLGVIEKGTPLSPMYQSNEPGRMPLWDTLSEAEKDTWDLRMATYAAMVETMDRGIERVLQSLAATGRLNNTLVLFMSDNGACHEEVFRWSTIVHDRTGVTGTPTSFDAYGYPWANVGNTPYRLFKSYTAEGGFTSPFIAWFPGRVKAGSILHAPAHVMDIMHTCLELAGKPYPATYKGHAITPTDGLSLWPLLTGKRWSGHDMLCWEHENSKAVWQGGWKLVQQRDEKTWQLYHLDKDRCELQPLQDKHPERVKAMQAAYAAWAKRLGVADDINALRAGKRQE
jgi:arylsulfatase